MDILNHFLDLIKLVGSGLIIFFAGWYVVKRFYENNYRSSLIQLKKLSLEKTLPLRLQAYERMILFTERINPTNLIVRLHAPGLTVKEFQQQILAEIKSEYQHNITQQLYVNPQSWGVINRLKDDTISLINNASEGLPPDAPSIELGKVVLTHLSTLETNPYDVALTIIRQEVQQFF